MQRRRVRCVEMTDSIWLALRGLGLSNRTSAAAEALLNRLHGRQGIAEGMAESGLVERSGVGRETQIRVRLVPHACWVEKESVGVGVVTDGCARFLYRFIGRDTRTDRGG